MKSSRRFCKKPVVLPLDTAETINCANLNVLPVQYINATPKECLRTNHLKSAPLILPAIPGVEHPPPQAPVPPTQTPWKPCFHYRERLPAGKQHGLKKSCHSFEYRSSPLGCVQRAASYDRQGKMTRVLVNYFETGDKNDWCKKARKRRDPKQKKGKHQPIKHVAGSNQNAITLSSSEEEVDFTGNTAGAREKADIRCMMLQIQEIQKYQDKFLSSNALRTLTDNLQQVQLMQKQIADCAEPQHKASSIQFLSSQSHDSHRTKHQLILINEYKPPLQTGGMLGKAFQNAETAEQLKENSGCKDDFMNRQHQIIEPSPIPSRCCVSSDRVKQKEAEIWNWMSSKPGDLNWPQSEKTTLKPPEQEGSLSYQDNLNQNEFFLTECSVTPSQEPLPDRRRTAVIRVHDSSMEPDSMPVYLEEPCCEKSSKNIQGLFPSQLKCSPSPLLKREEMHQRQGLASTVKTASATIPPLKLEDDAACTGYSSEDGMYKVAEGACCSASSVTPVIDSLASLKEVKSADEIVTPKSSGSSSQELEQLQMLCSLGSNSHGKLSDMYRSCFFKIMSKIQHGNIEMDMSRLPNGVTINKELSSGECHEDADDTKSAAKTSGYAGDHVAQNEGMSSELQAKNEPARNRDDCEKGAWSPQAFEDLSLHTFLNQRANFQSDEPLMTITKEKRHRNKSRHERLCKSKHLAEKANNIDSDSSAETRPKHPKRTKRKKTRTVLSQTVNWGKPTSLEVLKESLPRTRSGHYDFKSKKAQEIITEFVKNEILNVLSKEQVEPKNSSTNESEAEVLCSSSQPSKSGNQDNQSEKISTVKTAMWNSIVQSRPRRASKESMKKSVSLKCINRSNADVSILKSPNPDRSKSVKLPTSTRVASTKLNFIKYQQQSLAAMLGTSKSRSSKRVSLPRRTNLLGNSMYTTPSLARMFPLERIKKNLTKFRTNRNSVTVVFGTDC